MTLQSSRHTISENIICLLLCQSFFFISDILEGSFSSNIHSTHYWISNVSISSGHQCCCDVGYTHSSQSVVKMVEVVTALAERSSLSVFAASYFKKIIKAKAYPKIERQ